MTTIVALDFETADPGRDSACAIGMVRVVDGRLAERHVTLIRPPRPQMYYTHIHGLTWGMVADAPPFAAAWPDIAAFLDGADFLAAHNAGFDRAVMAGCCAAAGVEAPAQPYLCTVKLARAAWDIRPTRLPDVCRYLAIPLNHHDAGSDAAACAQIVADALTDGIDITRGLLAPRG
ncbi:MAG: 3'-5' exonuclease [Hyphomicrobiales bacterium]|nr:3'-5' exonuclease [Hyphomicrobiales bacterium]